MATSRSLPARYVFVLLAAGIDRKVKIIRSLFERRKAMILKITEKHPGGQIKDSIVNACENLNFHIMGVYTRHHLPFFCIIWTVKKIMSVDIHMKSLWYGNLGTAVIKIEEEKIYKEIEIKFVPYGMQTHPEFLRRMDLLIKAIKEELNS